MDSVSNKLLTTLLSSQIPSAPLMMPLERGTDGFHWCPDLTVDNPLLEAGMG